ncbi:MAG: Dyp-type peroxidase [bacterium]|nr:Dyp-type peroxidase [bacterium]
MEKNKYIPRPLPIVDSPYQSGISDPQFPLLSSIELEDDKDYELFRGRVDKQGFAAILKANVAVKNKSELKILFQLLSDLAYKEMTRTPQSDKKEDLARIPDSLAQTPESWRVTLTIAYGHSLFVDKFGNDRFGLSFRKPKNLKIIPKFPKDEFNPLNSVSDILILVASDHPYVNVAITRTLAEYVNKKFAAKIGKNEVENVFQVISVQQGFGRPDSKEFLKFNDGIDNLKANIDLEKLVYVDENCNEPDWCIGGSYMVYKKIREMMPVWEAFSNSTQEGIIGREKDSSLPLSRNKEGINNLTPVYPDPTDPKDGPLNAHIRKVQPRRPNPDLFGENDLNRRFLRRPYPFFDGVDENGKSINGLHFVAFMKSIQNQFEHVTNMWQMNPNFPTEGTGIDALYAKDVLKSIDGGYYFCPPARKSKDDFIGSGLFEETNITSYKIPKHIYGYGITFVDIDETIFRTYALINVIKSGAVIKQLTNQEFNEYPLEEGESFDFSQFKDAEKFLDTSQPIPQIISNVKDILRIVSKNSTGSRIVFLTARSDFDDKNVFLNTFRKYGIDIDSSRMYVERSGNFRTGTVAEKKKKIVMEYLKDGKYRRVRLIDDNQANLDEFLTIKRSLDSNLIGLIKKKHFLDDLTDPIEFYAYHVNHEGEMKLVGKE